MRLHVGEQTLEHEGNICPLAHRYTQILHLLALEYPRVVSYDRLMLFIGDEAAERDWARVTLQVTVSRLRSKIIQAGLPALILTRFNVGFCASLPIEIVGKVEDDGTVRIPARVARLIHGLLCSHPDYGRAVEALRYLSLA